MFIQVEPSDDSRDNTSDPKDNTNQKSKFTASLFQYVRTVFCLGGMFCGEGNNTRRWKKKVALLIFVVYLVHIPLYSIAIYDRFTKSENTTGLIGFLMICVADIYLSFVGLVKMPKALMDFEQVFNLYKEKYKSNFVTSNRLKRLRIMIALTLVNSVVFGPVQMFLYRHNKAILCDVYPSCNLPDNWKYFGFTLNAIFSFMGHIQWQGHFLVCVIFTTFLLQEFEALAKKFKDLSISSVENIEKEFEVLVEHHECLVDVLNGTNDCMCHYSFVIIFLAVPTNCLFLYHAMSKSLTEPELIFLCCIVTMALTFVGVKVFLEAFVSSKAHDPLRYIWKVRKGIISERGRQTLDLFVTRLTGETIGYNVYGLLSITMPTLLGIVGTLATYIIVVVQFRPTDAPLCHPTLVRNVTD
ncbi:uncharacterized protein LOC124142140 [Haliotis rufescens]|uniref:uncharacterized protein LOC124142140 n=1 Tax=Haliotis rufescens TaxID=6454 RepID=UPI00201ED2EA|nr:uncharacterized protein LOC124142140 [Haliotis rufescens]